MRLMEYMRERDKLFPDWLLTHKTYLNLTRGQINGNSLIISFMDVETERALYEIELPGHIMDEILYEYLQACFGMLSIKCSQEPHSFQELETALTDWRQMGYTYKAGKEPEPQVQPVEDPLNAATTDIYTRLRREQIRAQTRAAANRPQPVRRPPRVQPERVVDEPLGTTTAQDAAQRWVLQNYATTRGFDGILQGTPTVEGQLVPDPGLGNTLGRTVIAGRQIAEGELILNPGDVQYREE